MGRAEAPPRRGRAPEGSGCNPASGVGVRPAAEVARWPTDRLQQGGPPPCSASRRCRTRAGRRSPRPPTPARPRAGRSCCPRASPRPRASPASPRASPAWDGGGDLVGLSLPLLRAAAAAPSRGPVPGGGGRCAGGAETGLSDDGGGACEVTWCSARSFLRRETARDVCRRTENRSSRRQGGRGATTPAASGAPCGARGEGEAGAAVSEAEAAKTPAVPAAPPSPARPLAPELRLHHLGHLIRDGHAALHHLVERQLRRRRRRGTRRVGG